MGIIVGIIIGIIILSILKDFVINILGFLLKAAGIIILIGIVIFLIVLTIQNIKFVLSLLLKIVAVAAILLAIAVVISIVKSIIKSNGEKNKSNIILSISKDTKSLSPKIKYSSLVEKYMKKYSGYFIGENNLKDIVESALEDFCIRNTATVCDGVGQIISKIGMNEYNYIYEQCVCEYGEYCIGEEDIGQLISSEIELLGQKIYLPENNITLIKAPDSVGGTTYVQNHFEID